jgi:hypothetical protein
MSQCHDCPSQVKNISRLENEANAMQPDVGPPKKRQKVEKQPCLCGWQKECEALKLRIAILEAAMNETDTTESDSDY